MFWIFSWITLVLVWNHFAQISRLLVLDPAARLTSEQALSHPFFRLYQKEKVRLFSPRKTFRVSHSIEFKLYKRLILSILTCCALPPPQVLIISVRACIRMYSCYRRTRPLTREVLARDPYSLRCVRKLIDGCAFRIYGHWVKKGEQQNRAALFQNTAKIMLLGLEDFEP